MKIIVFANRKGGVAKTSSSCAFAAALKLKGYRVLAIDMDPQGNLSSHVQADVYKDGVFDLLTRKATIKDVIQKLDVFDIIPTTADLNRAELEITEIGKEHRLKEVLEPTFKDYDYIIIDTSTYIGTAMIMALSCADEIIIPANAQAFSLNGLNEVLQAISGVKKYINPKVKIAGILITAYDKRKTSTRTMKDAATQMSTMFEAPLFNTVIRISAAMEKAQINGQDIFTEDSKSYAAIDYMAFTEEYLNRKGE